MNSRNRFRWDSRSLAWAAAILAVSAGYSVLIAWPRMARARELTRTLQSEQAELNARCQSLDVIAKMERETALLTARIPDFDKRVPPEPLLGGFLEDLARIAKKHALQSDTIQPGETIRLDEVDALPIVVKVRGSFAGLHAMLQDIERMPRLTRIEQFKAISEPEHPGMVVAELTLRVFYRPSENGANTR